MESPFLLLLLIIGAISIALSEAVRHISEGWKSRDAESPDSARINIIRAAGIAEIPAGVHLLLTRQEGNPC